MDNTGPSTDIHRGDNSKIRAERGAAEYLTVLDACLVLLGLDMQSNLLVMNSEPPGSPEWRGVLSFLLQS